MELLVNDCSLHGQFANIDSFQQSVDLLMRMRGLCRQFGHELYCHRNLVDTNVTGNLKMRQAVNYFDRNTQRAFMQWLTRYGPFWDDERTHGPDDFLECNGQIVTDTGVGEAAFRGEFGSDCHLVSISPSGWEKSPLCVLWRREGGADRLIDILNYWQRTSLEKALRESSPPPLSWDDLEGRSKARFMNLIFSMDAFAPLTGHPFVSGCAGRILERLDILNCLAVSFDETGTRTEKGNRLYQEYFTGDKAWFSDSSRVRKINSAWN